MFSELNTESFTNITADGGIKKKMITQGTGDLIKENQEVGVKYCGNLKDQIFDQTYKEPFRYTIGNHEVPICWEIAAMTMKLGEKAEFIIEPKYGYLSLPGEKSKLPNFTISLEIEIVEINPPSKKLCDMNIFEKIEKAKKFKNEGVQKFGENDIEWALEKFERAIYFVEDINEKKDMKDNNDSKNNKCLNCHHRENNDIKNDNEIRNKIEEMNIGNCENSNLKNEEEKKNYNDKMEIENNEEKKSNDKMEIENKEKKNENEKMEIENKEEKKNENEKIEIENKEEKKNENDKLENENKEEIKNENTEIKTENNNINIESKTNNNKFEEIKTENNDNNSEISTNKKSEEEGYKEANELLISLYTNLSNCENHLKNYSKVLIYTSLGLKLRKTPKLLYFKTIAEIYSHNLDLAIENFNELSKLVKTDDKGIIFVKELIEKKQKEREEREKKFMRSIPRQILYENKEIKKSKSPPLTINPLNPKVYMNIKIGEKIKKIKIELFKNIVPITVENFKCLCTGEKGEKLNYKGKIFDKLIKNFIIKGGKIDNDNKYSIYGNQFENENYEYSHSRSGLLSMSNNGYNSNGSEFFITLKDCIWLDGKNVVFGKIIEGNDIIREFENIDIDENDIPKIPIVIDDCGEIKNEN